MAVADLPALRRSLVEYLRLHQLFATLSPDRLAALAEAATCHAFAPGEMILMDGAPSAGLWIVGEGRVKIYKLSADGSEHILLLLGPGDSFNDIAALDGGPNPAHADALSEVTACQISHVTLSRMIRRDPELAMTVIKVVAQRTRMLVRQVEDLALYSVRTRLARFLLEQSHNPSLSGPGITRATIAAHLAATPETVSRVLGSLEKAGIIQANRQEIIVLREDLLSLIAMV